MTTPPYLLVRSRRKTLALTFDREGRLVARAPMKLSEREIRAFIQKKAGWIARAQEQIRAAQPVKFTLSQGDNILLFGISYEIRRAQADAITAREHTLLIPADWDLNDFADWMKEQLKKTLPRRVEFYADQMGVRAASWKLSGARRRWGSCGPGGTLNFAWRLAMCPPEVIDYVVVHELAHLTHRDHSAAFWQRVADFMPEYQRHRDWLKQHHGLMELL
ncbi:MAG: M48 family metallopeptidase [Oscillospiraceae bacterium]|jgi:predicted metal-dependent hydrolase|nr:M48 family metallopeptidase [Oscillospiraceae bacterium]